MNASAIVPTQNHQEAPGHDIDAAQPMPSSSLLVYSKDSKLEEATDITQKPTMDDLIEQTSRHSIANEDGEKIAKLNTAETVKGKKAIKQQKGKTKKEKKTKNKKENKCTNSLSKHGTMSSEGSNLVNQMGSAIATACHNKPKLMPEELKLFQNNNLLNQQDPIQNLHLQLSQFINSDIVKTSSNHQLPASLGSITHSSSDVINHRKDPNLNEEQSRAPMIELNFGPGGDTCSTIKKGVLWQQQNFDKFHQRLFNRWKKRYFILTTDYLVCFKRSLPKVGRSEMGKFLYKTSLGDMLKVDWLKPNKSDKGSIVLHLGGSFNLQLWTKDNLDEWMFMIKESLLRYQARRSCLTQNGHTTKILACQDLPHVVSDRSGNEKSTIHADNLYENTNAPDSGKGDSAHTAGTSTTSGSQHNFALSSEDHKASNPKPKQRASKLVPSIESGLIEVQNIGDVQDVKSIPGAQLVPERPVINDPASHSETDGASNDCTKSVKQDIPGPEHGEENSQDMVGGKKKEECISGCERADEGKHYRASNDISQASSSKSGPTTENTSSLKRNKSWSRERRKDKVRHGSSDLAKADRQQRQSSLVEESEQQQQQQRHQHQRQDGSGELASGNGCDPDVTTTSSSGTNHSCGKATNEPASGDKTTASNGGQTAERTGRAVGPVPTNLIRRDDSWQSLVSLTRIGRAPTAMQVAQRSLYAQHIMPHSVDGGLTGRSPSVMGPAINPGTASSYLVESTVTPIRMGPFRHHSSMLQSHSSGSSRRPAVGQDWPSNNPQKTTPTSVSYHQKLLQLQLMHNSNNVDYIRQNSAQGRANKEPIQATLNDYQIYAPESTVYGYSSMRSNLKSAASEFSFIRPSSSSQIQSTLPHQNSAHLLVVEGSDATGRNERARLARSPSYHNKNNLHHPLRDTNNNLIDNGGAHEQFLADPLQASHLLGQQQPLTDCLVAPTRELPLKPNKKRTREDESSFVVAAKGVPKSSSLSSSIACFFRRAFSRRSKRRGKQRSKLAESCSSSLGAFENENFVGAPIVPSAFSTGSKSVKGRQASDHHHNSEHQHQPQRMVDMIEAFTSGNFSDQAKNFRPQATTAGQPGEACLVSRQTCTPNELRVINNNQQQQHHHHHNQQMMIANVTPARLPGISQSRTNAINQFASPLHKSNSISATLGLSLLDSSSAAAKRASFICDNDLRASQRLGGSPVLPRSTKVLSANLTPLRDPTMNQHHRLSVLSPLNGVAGSRALEHHQLPRPSSIYGEPSMIASSSPVTIRDDERFSSNLGSQKSNLLAYNIKTKVQVASGDLLRTQMMKANHLGTTQEEAGEDPSSAQTADSEAKGAMLPSSHLFGGHYDNRSSPIIRDHYVSRADALGMTAGSPSGGVRHSHHRRAVVNPILQSPTMSTIYDNHPMVLNGSVTNQSLYDNHRQDEQEQLVRFAQQQSPMVRRAKPSNSMTQFYPSVSSSGSCSINETNPYSSNHQRIDHQSITPSHSRQANMFLASNSKPAAIVAPSKPDLHGNSGLPGHLLSSRRNRLMLEENRYSPSRQQQSSVGNRGEPRYPVYVSGNSGRTSVAVNIAGAPGINLDPALAVSLLRGTNIDAYEAATYDDNQASGQPCADNSKTFLVSTRLSKSMAQHQSSSSQSNTGGSSSSVSGNIFPKSSARDDEMSSSTGGSQSESSRSSSKADKSNRRKASNSVGQSSSSQDGEDRLGDDSSSMDSNQGRRNRATKRNNGSAGSYCSTENSRDSKIAKQWIDSKKSNIAASMDMTKSSDDRNWITSKLVDRHQ